MHGNRGAGNGQRIQHVSRGVFQVDVAVNGGDRARHPAGGDQQEQRLGVIDAAIGIEDQPVG